MADQSKRCPVNLSISLVTQREAYRTLESHTIACSCAEHDAETPHLFPTPVFAELFIFKERDGEDESYATHRAAKLNAAK